uniref:Uncharacterized protein n=1 Tax=Cyprinodon variegatus TaxID=28743 RepID=A0A3Q2EG71_CYPVA
MTTEGNPGLGHKFFVILSGKTNGAHQSIVERLRDCGQTEVDSSEGCDYFLVFCPIVSRVGTDIHEALSKISDVKKAILVVMHHTFNPSHTVADSSRQVQKPNIVLTVDCLFYERELLRCDRNNNSMSEIEKILGVSWVSVKSFNWKHFIKRFKLPLLIALIVTFTIIIGACSIIYI